MPFSGHVRILAFAAALFVLSACTQQTGGAQDDAVRKTGRYAFLEAGSAASEWLTAGGTYDSQRYSLLEDVTPANVARLGVAWSHDLQADRGVEATPIVHDGAMYVTSAWSVLHAINAETGEALWKYDPGVDRKTAAFACCGVAGRGVAWKDGVLFLAVLDGRLEALDSKSGRVLWSVQTTDRGRPYTITGAPLVVKNMVLIGNSGAASGVRGYLSAYAADTGKLVWRFYTAPNPNKRLDGAASDTALTQIANASWGNSGAWKTEGGGGTVWDSIVYDVQNDQILFGTGSGSPQDANLRDPNEEGDNLFLSSIVAVDADSGQYRWHYQETPRDSWGYGAAQSILLADLPLGGNGAPRRVVLHAAANGFFYVLDAETGEYLSGRDYAPQTWAAGLDPDGRPIEAEGARSRAGMAGGLLPGAFAARGWNPPAFAPGPGLAFVPIREIPPFPAPDAAAGTAGMPLAPLDDEALARLRGAAEMRLVGWDPVRQEARWTVRQPAAGGGVLATASGLVFQGTADGVLAAYDAGNGRRLWHRAVGGGIGAPPVSYRVGDTQYVAISTGLGDRVALGLGYLFEPPLAGNRSRVIAFRLGARGKLPAPSPPSAAPELAMASAAPFGDVTMQELGRRLYAGNCAACHGAMAISSGVLPDVRRSPAAADPAMWRSLLIDGVGAENGMPGFGKQLSADDAEAIRSYVVLQANGQPPPAPRGK